MLVAGKHLLVDGCPGLRLEATQTRKTWTYRYKDGAGRMKQVKLGAWPGMALPDAVREWGARREQRDSGVDPVLERKREALTRRSGGVAASVEDLIGRFCDHLDTRRKAESALSARRALERVMEEEPAFAAVPPSSVTRAAAYAVLDARRQFPMATKKLRALLGQAWAWGQDAGVVDSESVNWWRQLMPGQLRSKGKIIEGEHVGSSRRVLRRDELKTLLPWARANMSQISLDATLMYLHTGMRGVEIFALRVEYITEEDDGWWITFPAHLLKQERNADIVDHRVPLMGVTLEIVRRRMAAAWDGWLFWTKRGKNLRVHNQKAFGSYVNALMPNSAKVKRRASVGLICPVANWSAHDLRRTARTLLSSISVPEDVGEAIIGHKPATMVASYNLHTYDEQKRDWVARLARLLGTLDKVSK